MGGELLTFDEALAELQMATHELRSLVAQGEIRAFRDEDVLKFRRTDILDLKKARETQAGGLVIEPEEVAPEAPTVAEAPEEPPAPGKEVKAAKHETEETELLAGIGAGTPQDFLGLDEIVGGPEQADTAQTVIPTIEISDEDMIDETAQTVVPMGGAEETEILSEAREAPSAPSLLQEEEEGTEMATQEIFPAEGAAGAGAATVVEEPLRFQEPATGEELGISTEDISAGATAGVTAPRRIQQYRAEIAAAPVSPVFVVLAIVTFVILLFAVPIFYGLATDHAPDFSPYKALIEILRKKTIG